MGNTIHPTAILEGNIELGTGNKIGPYVVMRGNIRIGDNNVIGSAAQFKNNLSIGNENRIYSGAYIGAVGEMGLKGDRLVEEGKVVIGNQVTIREFVCIHSPVYTLETAIQDQVYLMNKSYVAHDCVIGQGSVLSAGVLLGGRVVLEEGVTIGMGTTVHQRCHSGAYAMIGMQTPVNRDILPFATVAGNPARIIGFNRIGAERKAYAENWMQEMEAFYKNDVQMGGGTDNPMIQLIHHFLLAHPEALVRVRNTGD